MLELCQNINNKRIRKEGKLFRIIVVGYSKKVRKGRRTLSNRFSVPCVVRHIFSTFKKSIVSLNKTEREEWDPSTFVE